ELAATSAEKIAERRAAKMPGGDMQLRRPPQRRNVWIESTLTVPADLVAADGPAGRNKDGFRFAAAHLHHRHRIVRSRCALAAWTNAHRSTTRRKTRWPKSTP